MEDILKNEVSKNDYTSGDAFFSCHVERANSVISGKWKILILYKLSLYEFLRYSALKEEMGLISEKMLIQQLKELEKDGLVSKKVYAVSPPKVEYHLTIRGMGIIPVITALRNWGCLLKHTAI